MEVLVAYTEGYQINKGRRELESRNSSLCHAQRESPFKMGRFQMIRKTRNNNSGIKISGRE